MSTRLKIVLLIIAIVLLIVASDPTQAGALWFVGSAVLVGTLLAVAFVVWSELED